MKPLDLTDLGRRLDDPKFYTKSARTEPEPYGPKDEAIVKIRSRNIILTDDYAPVENLLAPSPRLAAMTTEPQNPGRTVQPC